MTKYNITSKAGNFFGAYEGANEKEAFMAMLRDAGGEYGAPHVGTEADWVVVAYSPEYQRAAAQYGEVEYEGKTLALTQQAYCSNGPDLENMTYQAHAIDADGAEYRVTWDCLPGWMEMEDESDCCDWTDYTVSPL